MSSTLHSIFDYGVIWRHPRIEFNKKYIVVKEVSGEHQAFFADVSCEPQVGDTVEFQETFNGSGQIARMVLNGEEIGFLHVSAMNSLFFIGSDPAKTIFRSFILAEPIDAKEVLAGVPIDDVYA